MIGIVCNESAYWIEPDVDYGYYYEPTHDELRLAIAWALWDTWSYNNCTLDGVQKRINDEYDLEFVNIEEQDKIKYLKKYVEEQDIACNESIMKDIKDYLQEYFERHHH